MTASPTWRQLSCQSLFPFFSRFLLVLSLTGAAVGAVAASTIVVPVGGNLQSAINNAQPGDTIVLQAGATYSGTFILPFKAGAEYITIQSSRVAELPEDGRVSPAHAPMMARIQTISVQPAILTALRAHHYKLIGLEFAPTVTNTYGLIHFGDGGSGGQNSLDVVPHHLVVDRCYLHGLPGQNVQRGIALNSSETSVLNSYISEIHWLGTDSQAIGGWNGPGPFHIINNYLEAGAENILFGGATPGIPNLIPSDIEIRRNYFYKPLSWMPGHPTYTGYNWSIKNLLELKSARRVTIDGNILENNWPHAQQGYAILFTVGNDSGPWAQIEDVQFTNNIVRHVASGVNIRALDWSPGSGVRRVTIANNLFEDVGAFSGEGKLFQLLQGPIDLTINHNTAFHTGSTIIFDGVDALNFTYINNIANHNAYGVFGNGGYIGSAGLAQYTINPTFLRNVLFGADPNRYPSGNYYPRLFESSTFVNFAGGNYRLAAGSPYRNAGTDGTDIGVNMDALEAALAGVTSNPAPTPTPTPTPTPISTPTPTPTPIPSPQFPTPSPTPGTPSSFIVTASPSSLQSNVSLSVTWNVPQGRSSTDWIGLFRVNDPNTTYSWWQYTNGAASGAFTLAAPSSPGSYQFRYLLNNGYTSAAVSNTVIVAATPAPSPSPTPSPDFVWIEDHPPAGASLEGDNEFWSWVS